MREKTERIGRQNENGKPRPIEIRMTSKEDADDVYMRGLTSLVEGVQFKRCRSKEIWKKELRWKIEKRKKMGENEQRNWENRRKREELERRDRNTEDRRRRQDLERRDIKRWEENKRQRQERRGREERGRKKGARQKGRNPSSHCGKSGREIRK